MLVSRTADMPRSSDIQEAEPALSHTHPQLYRPDIDGLRAVAALAVVAAHAGWLRGGGFGVDIFFVISGFLISGIIFRFLQDGRFSLVDFYARRVKRIFPALIVLLASVSILGWIVLPSAEQLRLGQSVAAGAGFAENLWIYTSVEQDPTLVELLLWHLWTLGIEEQFYLVWPMLLTTTWLLLRRWQLRLMTVTAALSLGSYGWTLFADPRGVLLPWNRLWELALGAMLAYLQHAESMGRRRAWIAPFLQPPISHSFGTIGAACAIVALTGLAPFDKLPSRYAWVPVLGTFLLMSAGPNQWINRRLLASRPMVFIGLISYPLYLWHWPLFMFATILNGSASNWELPVAWKISVISASMVLSYVTYRYVELPLRSSRNTRGVALLLCIAMAACGTVAYSVLV